MKKNFLWCSGYYLITSFLIANLMANDVSADDAFIYGSFRPAVLAGDSGLNWRDQGTKIGLWGNGYSQNTRLSFPYRFEVGVRTSAAVHDDDEERKLAALRIARIGIKNNVGEINIGKQWSPYYNFLSRFTDVFQLRNSINLFSGSVCSYTVGYSGVCTDQELDDDRESDDDYGRLDSAVSFSTVPTDKVDSQYDSLHGFEAQLALSKRIISYAAGFFSQGSRFGNPEEFSGIAVGSIHNLRDDSYSYGITFGTRTAAGNDLGATIEYSRILDRYNSYSGKFTLVAHDLTKFVPPASDDVFLNDMLKNGRLKFGLSHQKVNLENTDVATNGLLIGVDFTPSVFWSVGLEYALQKSGRSESHTIGLHGRISWEQSISKYPSF